VALRILQLRVHLVCFNLTETNT